jgi:hypothetical protein
MLTALAITRSTLVAGALTLVPATPLVCDQVDVLELNCVYDGEGRLLLRQMIFWDWRHDQSRYEVVAWRLWQDDFPLPVRDWHSGAFVLLWSDAETLRSVRARAFWQTWTQHDPEMEDRRQLSQHLRRGLSARRPPGRAATYETPPR